MMDLKTHLFNNEHFMAQNLKKQLLIQIQIMLFVGNQRKYLNLNLYTAFLHSIKLSENKAAIKFDKYPLTVQKLLDQNCKCLYLL